MKLNLQAETPTGTTAKTNKPSQASPALYPRHPRGLVGALKTNPDSKMSLAQLQTLINFKADRTGYKLSAHLGETPV